MSIPPPPGPQQPGDPYQQYPSHPGYPEYSSYPQAQGPAPYGQLPYQPWGQGYSPFNHPAPVNGLAIGALVLGLLCFLPGVGLVLGLVALSQIRKRGERGRGMAIAGSVLSGIGIGLWALVIATGGAADFWDGFKEGARGGSSLTPAKGECIDVPGGSMTGAAYDLDTVPCDSEHDGEVFASFRLPGGSFPGDDSITDTADERCYGLSDSYAMDTWALPENVDVYYLTPSEDSWSTGDREVTCMFGNTEDGEKLSGSLRNDETVLDADQVAYLKAAHVLNAALETVPDEEYVEDDLPGYKSWAGRVDKALAGQSAMLRGHTWPAAAKQPVAALVAGIGGSRAEWARAAVAADADAYYTHYDKGLKLLDRDRPAAARKALGLATTPPPYDESDSDGRSGSSGDGGGMEV
ncbi:DUF4190 domain-containing protein [Streptomyces sp. NPDC086787]|uniref:DUF4190 domain-containing protein n=1 Tax=Streptomyces sp. NPDC086787 TaxID=3365759 RepID=UPI003813239C